MEVMCPKPGNVGPDQPFSNLEQGQIVSVTDFLKSAVAIAPIASEATSQSIGKTILACVQATQNTVGHNTNLGIILLLVPLAAVPKLQSLRDGIDAVLDALTVEDSCLVYRAIRLAEPGGLGSAEQQDVRDEPQLALRACMQLAADRDAIALQYHNGFQQVLGEGTQLLNDAQRISSLQQQQITWTALNLLASMGDTLILRKCGISIHDQVRKMAQDVLACNWPASALSEQKYRQFDQFLRADGNRRNPGTTADMIAAILFAALREKRLQPEGTWWQPPSDVSTPTALDF